MIQILDEGPIVAPVIVLEHPALKRLAVEPSASSIQEIRIILRRESISFLSLISSASCRRNILFV